MVEDVIVVIGYYGLGGGVVVIDVDLLVYGLVGVM